MNRREVGRVLKEIAGLMRLRGEQPFRVRAMEKAARVIERADEDVETLVREHRLVTLEGVGKGIDEIVRELVETGSSTIHRDLTADMPAGLPRLLRVPGLGAKRLHAVHTELGVSSLEELEEACEDGRLAGVSGFGPRTVETVMEGVRFLKDVVGRMHYPDALEVALQLRERLRALPDVFNAEIAGELRRSMETVGEIALVVSATDPAQTLDQIEKSGIMATPAERPSPEVLLIPAEEESPIRILVADPASFPVVLMRETGSETHLEHLRERAGEREMELGDESLRSQGTPVEVHDEAGIYEALGLAMVPPELREGADEVERAAADRLPTLVSEEDVGGVFHCHTTYSDGRATLEAMAAAACERGWCFLGLGDHSQAAAYAGGLTPEEVREQQEEIDSWNRENGDRGLRLLKGIESDILADGSLDYDGELLASFDYVVGSVHSGFSMKREAMTERLLRAVRHPRLTILGHPTGRLLLRRDPYPVDLRAVVDEAVAHGVILEINSNPFRLELDWREVRYAAAQGALFAVNPDAHSTSDLDYVTFGINVARKGGLEPEQLINSWPLERIERYLEERRARADGAGAPA